MIVWSSQQNTFYPENKGFLSKQDSYTFIVSFTEAMKRAKLL